MIVCRRTDDALDASARFCFLVYEEYIFADVRKRHDLAFAWLYQEYVYANGFLSSLDPNKRKDFTKYDDTLCRLLEYLQEKPDQREGYSERKRCISHSRVNGLVLLHLVYSPVC